MFISFRTEKVSFHLVPGTNFKLLVNGPEMVHATMTSVGVHSPSACAVGHLGHTPPSVAR